MASFSIVEHLDVVEQIGARFISRVIAHTVHALSLARVPTEADKASLGRVGPFVTQRQLTTTME